MKGVCNSSLRHQSISLHHPFARAQVQYAASEATRAFLQAAPPFREEVLQTLLPPMCFNRHITAEGLRAYSQVGRF